MAIDFVDPETGFEALQDGDLLRTDDGGTTWDVVSHKGFAALSFVSAPVGFGLTDHAYVLETTDGGRSWRERLNGASKAGYPDAGVGSLDFLNAQDGWAAPYQSGRIYRTTNGGASWDAESRVCVGATSAFSFVNVARGFRICGYQPGAGNQDKDLFATADGGSTWVRRACARPTSRDPSCGRGRLPGFGYVTQNGLDFRDLRTGLLVTDRGGIWRTTDGGKHWRMVLLTDDKWSIADTSWASNRIVYALISKGAVLFRSGDAGAQWRRVTNGATASCRDPALGLSAQTEGEATGTAIFLDATNRSREPCAVNGSAQIAVHQAGHRARIDGNPISIAVHKVLPPGQKSPIAEAWWGNWCGSRPGLSVVVRYGGRELRPRVRPLPVCISRAQASTLGR